MKNRLYLFLFLFASLFFRESAFANFMVTPGSATLDTTGKNTTQNFIVENLSKKELVVEVSLMERMQDNDKDGGVKVKDYSKLFKIYPKIIKVYPNKKKAILVKWIGPKDFDEEKAYFLKVSEKQIKKEKKLSTNRTEIALLIEYYLNLFVSPKSKKEKIELESSKYLEKEKAFKITLKNSGNVHYVSRGDNLILSKKDNNGNTQSKTEFSRKELMGYYGKVILPGKKRDILLLAPKNFEGNDVVIKLSE